MTLTSVPSMTATTELVVPRSIPMILLMGGTPPRMPRSEEKNCKSRAGCVRVLQGAGLARFVLTPGLGRPRHSGRENHARLPRLTEVELDRAPGEQHVASHDRVRIVSPGRAACKHCPRMWSRGNTFRRSASEVPSARVPSAV